MKRGCYAISVEKLKEVVELPPDFEMSDVVFTAKHNEVEIFGYSDVFDAVPELCQPVRQPLPLE